jgi:hypothetical protein
MSRVSVFLFFALTAAACGGEAQRESETRAITAGADSVGDTATATQHAAHTPTDSTSAPPQHAGHGTSATSSPPAHGGHSPAQT